MTLLDHRHQHQCCGRDLELNGIHDRFQFSEKGDFILISLLWTSALTRK